MNMLLRFWFLLLQIYTGFVKPAAVGDAVVRSYRILLHDLGWRDHLPNYRFLSFVELNITQWVKMQTGVKKGAWLMATQEIMYLKPMLPFSRFTISSQLIGWDLKYFFMRHEFRVKGKLTGISVCKIMLLDNKKPVSPALITGQEAHITDEISSLQSHQLAVKEATKP